MKRLVRPKDTIRQLGVFNGCRPTNRSLIGEIVVLRGLRRLRPIGPKITNFSRHCGPKRLRVLQVGSRREPQADTFKPAASGILMTIGLPPHLISPVPTPRGVDQMRRTQTARRVRGWIGAG